MSPLCTSAAVCAAVLVHWHIATMLLTVLQWTLAGEIPIPHIATLCISPAIRTCMVLMDWPE